MAGGIDPFAVGEYGAALLLAAGGTWARFRIRRAEDKTEQAEKKAEDAESRAVVLAGETEIVRDKADDARVASVVAGHVSKLAHDQSIKALEANAALGQMERMWREQQMFSQQQAEQHARELGKMTANWEACERRHEESAEIINTLRSDLGRAQGEIDMLRSTVEQMRDNPGGS